MAFVEYVAGYYRRRLDAWEALDPATADPAALLAAAGEASALRKFLADIAEEGYAGTVRRLEAATGARARLGRFLAAALPRLGPEGEAERFSLAPRGRLAGLPLPAAAGTGPAVELDEYLAGLEARAERPGDLGACFPDAGARRAWEGRTATILAELGGFLGWLAARLEATGAVPVPVLRDTLLVHLGLGWLRRRGRPLRPCRPLAIGRAFADRFGDGRDIHGTLGDLIYDVLLERDPCDLATLRGEFARRALAAPGVPAAFTRASRACLEALGLDAPPLFVESGVQGTFPLWLLALGDGAGDLALYATLPWLGLTYAGRVYQPNYNYLRDVETLVAHDHLFTVAAVGDGRVRVAETRDERARCLALHEIRAFRRLVEGGPALSSSASASGES